MAERLDPLTLPLAGSRLIEASAGTGKTWTIAALVLRLVLGHGTPRALAPAEILVMTFTKAATRELSDRIRARLVEAAAVFRGDAGAGDDFLAALLQAHPPGDARQQAAWRLAAAAEGMDDAAIHTIDAWCQRMLREHAFDSGSAFDEQLQPDEAALRQQAVRDWWRREVYPLQGDALAVLLAAWPSPDALAQALQPLWETPLAPPAGTLAQWLGAAIAQLVALKAAWPARGDDMLAHLQRWRDAGTKGLPNKAHVPGWVDKLRAWALDPALLRPEISEPARRALSRAAIAAAVGDAHVPPCFDAFDALLAALDATPDVPAEALRHAAASVQARVAQLKAQAGTFGFADLLRRLDDALDTGAHGARAEALRARIVAQYPAALVDEFQDTSPVQLSILDRLYRIASDDPARVLLLIGDPKQSIYAFRGADIGSYLQARRATAGRHHVLGTNHRSTPALVAAVNRLFAAAEARSGGAFGYRDDAGDSPLPFVAVDAKGRAETLGDATAALPAITLLLDAEPRSKEDAMALFAAHAAEAIVARLNDAQLGFREPWQRLQPADIAVLVRTGREAAAVRRELQRRGVASVYLSDQDSVFASPEAADLLRLLQAVAAPRDVRLARAALATPLFARTLDELRALAADDALFDRQADVLQQLAAAWPQQGVLAMLRRALHAFGLPARLLALPQGERRLTNVLHLAELLQAASAQVHGEQALIRWLAVQTEDAGRARADEQVLRLESDAALVKVVTVHKSKGLEYPLVFLPFAAHFREGDSDDAERLREDTRLLYVALTRARHALWVGVAALRQRKDFVWPRSALGRLVSGTGPVSPEQMADAVRALAASDTVVVEATEEPPPVTRLAAREAPPPLAAAPVYDAAFDRTWAIASYSAIVRDVAAAPSGVLPARVLRDDEPEEDAQAAAAGAPWHRFPRGAYAGNFLHDQLEWLAREGFALDDSPALQRTLVQRCERQGWGARADDVLAWLRRLCSTPLPPLGAPLAALPVRVPELEFWLPIAALDTAAVDALCRQHLLPGRDRPALPPRALHGMLMGFADLVFEHDGRFWVLDHKSNALGTRDADYTPAAMEAAMLQHRYDVQAALYALALRRLLRARGADTGRIAGALYLFLRGVAAPSAGALHLPVPAALLHALDAMLPGVGA